MNAFGSGSSSFATPRRKVRRPRSSSTRTVQPRWVAGSTASPPILCSCGGNRIVYSSDFLTGTGSPASSSPPIVSWLSISSSSSSVRLWK